NGAPSDEVAAMLDSLALPPNVGGVALVGSVVAYPMPEVHNFAYFARRGASGRGAVEYKSRVDETLARTIMERTNASAGVRATAVRWHWQSRAYDLIFRAGERRIFPYNLILDVDPDRDRGRTLPLDDLRVRG